MDHQALVQGAVFRVRNWLCDGKDFQSSGAYGAIMVTRDETVLFRTAGVSAEEVSMLSSKAAGF